MDRRRGLRRSLYAAPLAGLIILGGAGISAAQEQPAAPAPAAPAPAARPPSGVDVPQELEPPAGNVMSSVFAARGVQVYQCTDGKWVFAEPVASLMGRPVRGPGGPPQTVIHFRGPSWESADDGSLVEGAVAASSPSPGTIPQLLVKAVKNRGTGTLGAVTFVQRLATRGGTAPAAACTTGASAGVPYTAIYRFFTAEPLNR